MERQQQKPERRTASRSGQTYQIVGLTEWTQAHWLPSRLHKTPESTFLARRSPFENENRSTRNPSSQRQATPLLRDKSSKLASDSWSLVCVPRLLPIRLVAGGEAAPRPKSRHTARLE